MDQQEASPPSAGDAVTDAPMDESVSISSSSSSSALVIAASPEQPSPDAAAVSSALLPASAPPLVSASSASRGAGVALNVLSAAKATLTMAPIAVEGAFSLAQSGTESFVQLTRRSVERGAEAARAGVKNAGEAAASKLQSMAQQQEDKEKAEKYARWSSRALKTAEALDWGLDRGADWLEGRILPAVGTVAQGGLKLTSWSLRNYIKGARGIVHAADVGTKAMLKHGGVSIEEISSEIEHEKVVEAIQSILEELKRLNNHIADVGTAELIRCLQTYARLVETVEAQRTFANRRVILPDHLASISAERERRERARERSSREDPLPPQEEALPIVEPRSAGLSASPSSSPSTVAIDGSPTTEAKKAGWWSGWVQWAKAATSSKAAEPLPTPINEIPVPSSSPSIHSYEEGLFSLAGQGMTKMSRAMLFAGAIYGPRFLRFMGLPTVATTHEEFLLEQSGIAVADIIQASFSSTLQHPGFALLLDHKCKRIMLVIRGSSNLHDAIMDLTCESVKHISGSFGQKGHAEGWCHSGMLNSAKWFMTNLRQSIIEQLAKNPFYEFCVCGHSLGAGIGSLFVLLALHDTELNSPARPIYGAFFGSPCVVSPELVSLGYGYCVNFILGVDIVPRLSKGAVEDLCEIVLQLTQESRDEKKLYKLASKERKIEKARLDKIKEEEAAKREAEIAKGNKLPPLPHEAAFDHTKVATLLDRYHEIEKKKKQKQQEEKEASSERKETGATSSSSASSSTTAAEDEELDNSGILDELHSILLHLRKRMVHDKLFPFGHVLHLQPRDEDEEDETGAATSTAVKEDAHEKKELNRVAKELSVKEQLESKEENEDKMETNETVATSSSSVPASAPVEGESDDSAEAESHDEVEEPIEEGNDDEEAEEEEEEEGRGVSFWQAKKPIHPRAIVHMHKLHQILDGDLIFTEKKKNNKLLRREGSIHSSAKGSDGEIEGDSAAAKATSAAVSSASAPPSLQNSATPIATPSVASVAPPAAALSSTPHASPSLLPATAPALAKVPSIPLPIAMPIARVIQPTPPPAAAPPQPALEKKKSIPVALPVAAPIGKNGLPLPTVAPSASSNNATSVSAASPVVAMEDVKPVEVSPPVADPSSVVIESKKTKSVSPDSVMTDVDTSSTATSTPVTAASIVVPSSAIASSLPIAITAFSPPVAAPIPVPKETSAQKAKKKQKRPHTRGLTGIETHRSLFTNPPHFDLIAGHWSDLTDLVLSSRMLQHHLPAVYLVALATHETTKSQQAETRNQKLTRLLAMEHQKYEAQKQAELRAQENAAKRPKVVIPADLAKQQGSPPTGSPSTVEKPSK